MFGFLNESKSDNQSHNTPMPMTTKFDLGVQKLVILNQLFSIKINQNQVFVDLKVCQVNMMRLSIYNRIKLLNSHFCAQIYMILKMRPLEFVSHLIEINFFVFFG